MLFRKELNIFKILLLSFIVGTISCNKFDDLKSPVEGFSVILNYDIFDTFITIRLIDAKTGTLIGTHDDEKIEVNITGSGANAIVDQLGNHSTNYKSVYGMISLALNPKNPWVPSPGNIITLNFEANGERFKTTNIGTQIDSTGSYSFNIYMEQNNVEKLGIKEYTFFLPLNNDNSLSEDFQFESTGSEIYVEIPKGSVFLDTEGNTITGQKVRMNLKIFLNRGKAPAPTSLINNLKNLDEESLKMAIDFYNIIELSFFSENGLEIKEIRNKKVTLKYRISNNSYHPIKKRLIQKADKLFAYNYNLQTKYWEENESIDLRTDSIGFYAITQVSHFSVKATGNSTNTCNLDGRVKFQFQNTFDELPVGTRLILYRKRDNRYIGNNTFQVENTDQNFNFNFISIENEPVRFLVYNESSYNPFTADPANFYSNISCNTLAETLGAELTSIRTQINGQLKISYENDLPTEGIDIYLDIYNASNNARMYRKFFKIDKSNSTLNFATGIIANQDVYLKLVPVENFIDITTTPEQIYFNTTTGPFIWETSLKYADLSSKFIFEFNINEYFENRELWLRADFLNRETEKIDQSFTFSVSKNNSSITEKVMLQDNTSYRVNLKRIEGKEPFMAFPYKYYINSNKEIVTNIKSELLPVEKKLVEVNLSLSCGSSIIYPSVNAMYRTIWDDKWNETEIKDGYFTEILELGAMYEIGTIFEGELVSTEYKITTAEINLTIEMEGDICDKMGW